MPIVLRVAVPVALVALVGVADVARADRIALLPANQRAVSAPTVLTGKVTAVAKDTVAAPAPYPGARDKIAYTVATVAVTEGLIGADKVKEVKVGFVAPKGRGGFQTDLKEGQEVILFLIRHPSADFYVVPGMSLPIETTTEAGKKDLESVRAVAAVLADPAKALKAGSPEARGTAAALVVLKYRQFPAFGGETEQVALGAEESKLLLATLAEGNWSTGGRRYDEPPTPFQAFQALGLTDKDAWVPPVVANAPGAPPVDFGLVSRDAFVKWLDGPGKDYRIKKVAPKAATK
ncbi:hypothetical protein [Gemmata sp.]|uniref:hypothetical protein n=1 Tax=Gemmata sp. TaxID=1914242 RepID=UPI003F72C25B